MFIIRLSYKKSMTEVDNHLQAHRDYLDYYYQQGLLIASGPLIPRKGGIIIAATNDRNYLEQVIKQDPYHQLEIADYELMEFTPVKYCVELKDKIL